MANDRKGVSSKHEKSAAKQLGARQHRGSGSGHRRFDMSNDTSLIECKTVLEGKKQITLKAEVLKALTRHAYISDQIPTLHIRLDGTDYVLHRADDFCERFKEI